MAEKLNLRKRRELPSKTESLEGDLRKIQNYIMERITKATNGCWNWNLSKRQSYGTACYRGFMVLAHRLSYSVFVGDIPDGLVLDHLCRNTRCVNPEHLEAVTDKVNILRSSGLAALSANKKECIHGHAFDSINTRVAKNGRRECRECRRIKQRKSYHKIKASGRVNVT